MKIAILSIVIDKMMKMAAGPLLLLLGQLAVISAQVSGHIGAGQRSYQRRAVVISAQVSGHISAGQRSCQRRAVVISAQVSDHVFQISQQLCVLYHLISAAINDYVSSGLVTIL
jgi:hypothetical protein